MNGKAILLILALFLIVGSAIADTTFTFKPISDTADGYVMRGADGSFLQVRNGNGDNMITNPVSSYEARILSNSTGATTQGVDYIRRGEISVNSAQIYDSSTIKSAQVCVWGQSKEQSLGTPTLSLIGATPGNPNSLANGDYQTHGSDLWATDISYAAFSSSNNAYTCFNLNPVGIGNISKTGTTSFMIAIGWDAANSTTGMTWANAASSGFEYADSTSGASTAPYLNVTVSEQPQVYPIAQATNTTKTFVLPNSDTNLGTPGLNLTQVNVTSDQFEPLTFALKPNETVSDMTVTASDLSDGAGHTIPNASLDIRGVKVWYQACDPLRTSSWCDKTTYGQYLAPELLLKDLTLINTSLTNQNETIRITNGTVKYVPISNTSVGQFPQLSDIWDNATAKGDMQPFAATALQNQQIWITVHCPAGQTPGTYTGKININSTNTQPLGLNVTVVVSSLVLKPPVLTYSFYDRTTITSPDSAGWYPDNSSMGNSPVKPQSVYAAELTDMKNHGISYPIAYNSWDRFGTSSYNDFERMLQLRNSSGLPSDRLFMISLINPSTGIYTPLSGLTANLTALQNQSNVHGFNKVNLFGLDEPSSAQVTAEIPTLFGIYNNGSGTVGSTSLDTSLPAASVLKYVNLAGAMNQTNVALYRAANPAIKILSYANPQGGIENPQIYRENYGFKLWVAGYDGMMEWAYQSPYGQSYYNDYDSDVNYTTESFTYPKSDGVIDTIQYEGLRQAVDDTRFADELSRRWGSKDNATSIINAGITANLSMEAIRQNVIDAIGNAPDQNWTWNFGDGETSYLRNPQHTYTSPGTYDVSLTTCNAHGCDTMTKIAYITADSGIVAPIPSFTKNRFILPRGQQITVTDTSTNTPTSWDWRWGDGTANATTATASHRYGRTGVFSINLESCNAAGCSDTNQWIWAYGFPF